jgi:hypothetical protein
MNAQHNCDENEKAGRSLPKRPYVAPVLLPLGSFKDLTLTVGGRGNNDGGKQSGRKSTRF